MRRDGGSKGHRDVGCQSASSDFGGAPMGLCWQPKGAAGANFFLTLNLTLSNMATWRCEPPRLLRRLQLLRRWSHEQVELHVLGL